jgi:hypothetical protein
MLKVLSSELGNLTIHSNILISIIPSFEDETRALASIRPQGCFAKP